MKIKLLITITFIFAISLAQSQEISNIDFKQSGQNLIVSYNISGLAYNQEANISLFVSMNNGKTFIGPLKEIQGDFGKGITNGTKVIQWEVFKEIPDFSGNIVFDVRAEILNVKQQSKIYLGYAGSFEAPMGIKLGTLNNFGFYISARFNPDYFINSTYETDGEMVLDYPDSGFYQFTGNQKKQRLSITVGLSKQITRNLHIYAGGGFASYSLLWQVDEYSYTNGKTETSYAKHTSESFNGFELEGGLKAQFSKIFVSAGVSSPQFQWVEFVGSIGYVL